MRISPLGPLSTRGEGENKENSKVARRGVLQYAPTRKAASLRGLLVVLIVVALIGTASVPPAQAQGKRLRIVASFSILADVARNVTGDAADVETLIPLGADPHEFEPSAQDAVTLSEADVVLTVGLDFEQTLSSVLNEAAVSKVVSVSACVPVREISNELLNVQPHSEGAPPTSTPGTGGNRVLYQVGNLDQACPAHEQLVDQVFGAGALVHDGTLGLAYQDVCHDTTCDPHVWMDPANTALWALMIRDTLIQLDPSNGKLYMQNTQAYLQQLAALDHEIAAEIEAIPPERRVILTNHAAFNYFAARYGLQVVGAVIPGGSTGTEPSVQDVLKLVQTVQNQHVPAIFTETTANQNLAQQIADETGAQIVQLYTGSLSAADGPAGTYLDYMRYNAGQIAGALK
jgi:manganese/iron transport system substrate-binding protein